MISLLFVSLLYEYSLGATFFTSELGYINSLYFHDELPGEIRADAYSGQGGSRANTKLNSRVRDASTALLPRQQPGEPDLLLTTGLGGRDPFPSCLINDTRNLPRWGVCEAA
jgi:hypothetical protein